MARSRNIKPGFFANEHLAQLPFETRLLFIGLWTLADKEGRVEDRPTKIKMQLFANDAIDVDAALEQLASAGEPFVVRYAVDDMRVIQIVNWSKHQKPHHQEQASTLPEQENFAPRCEPVSDQGTKRSKEGISVKGIKEEGIKEEGIKEEGIKEEGIKEEGIRNQKREAGPASPNRAVKNTMRSYPPEFQMWWGHYPNKAGKPSAFKAFAPALARIRTERDLAHVDAVEWLIDRTKAYARSVADASPQHIKHPGPWLNDDRFNDEPAPAKGTSLKIVSAGTRHQANAGGFGDGF